jgi:hypothetical protein
MKGPDHVVHMRRKRMHLRFLLENQKEGYHWEDPDTGEYIILKWV